jgi:esterase
MTHADGNPLTLYSKTRGNGPHLIILHGLFGDHQNWSSQARTLADKFTVHTLDLRNHGRSEHSPQMNYPSMAADVALTCKQLQIYKTHLIGHSMGGKVAMQLSQSHPTLIERLAIVDIAPRRYPAHHGDVLSGLRALSDHPPGSRSEADETLAHYVDDAGIRAFLLKNLQRTDSGFGLRINLDTIEASYPDIAAGIDLASPFSGPTLFIKGEQSDYLQASDREAIEAGFPNARLKVIGGAGHWPHAEKPNTVSKILMDFLQA